MKNYLLALLVLAGILLAETTIAQQRIKYCDAMEQDALLRRKYPQMGSLESFEQWLGPKVAERAILEAASRTDEDVIRIPTIVHIIHLNEAVGTGTNISDAQVLSQIRVMNDGFRKKPGTLGYSGHPLAADVRIEFALAARTPAGAASNGIMRYPASTWGASMPMSRDILENTIKPATIWNPNEYFNIWVVDFSGGLLGYAQFPTQSGLLGFTCLGYSGAAGLPTTDGVGMDYSAFGSNEYGNFPGLNPSYQNGKVTLHEVGHWIGLRHMWGDASCGSDYVEDTPIHDGPSSACSSHPVPNSCGTADEMFENHMDYGSDACKNIFTYGQGVRMRTVLTNCERRRQLLTSPGAVPPIPNDVTLQALLRPFGDSCATSFAPRIRFRNTGTATLTSLKAGYKIDNGAWQTTTLSPSVPSKDSAAFDLPSLTIAQGEHIITVYVAEPNGTAGSGQGVDTLKGTFRVGSARPTIIQLFEQKQFPPRYWYVKAPDRACYKWFVADCEAGALGAGASKAAGFRTSGDAGANQFTSGLYTELYDLPAAVPCTLSFDYSCAIGTPGTANAFTVQISKDCGATWETTPLASFTHSDGNLYTATQSNFNDEFWTPVASSEWKRVTISLGFYQGKTVRFRFNGSLSGYGGLFVDNIIIRPAAEPAPTITRLDPDSGIAGNTIRLYGTGLGSATSVSFAGQGALTWSSIDTVITAEVPVGAKTGSITVRTLTGTAISSMPFRVLHAPEIKSFWPAGGPVGTSVQVRGSYLTGLRALSFNGTAATFSVLNDSTVNTSVPAGATTGKLRAENSLGFGLSTADFLVGSFVYNVMQPGTLTTCNSFLYDPQGPGNYVNNLDVITTLAPEIAGNQIALTLQEFSTASSGDVLRVYDGPSITGTLLGAFSGTFSLMPASLISSAPGGELTLRFTTNATTVAPGFKALVNCVRLTPPEIHSFVHVAGRTGTNVAIRGSKFISVREVRFNGILSAFSQIDSGLIIATVPTAATTGPITVMSPGGTDTSAMNFTILDVFGNCMPSEQPLCGVSAIRRVTLMPGGLRNTTICNRYGHTAFFPADSLTATLIGGRACTLTVVAAEAGYAGAWIDLNRSGGFSSSEFFASTNLALAGQPVSFTIPVPSGLAIGYLNMRVAFGQSPFTSGSVCAVPATGSLHDYILSYVPTLNPIITELNPGAGPVGTSVRILGYNLDGPTQVTFANNLPATFTAVSSNEIRATVPAGAVNGFVNVTNAIGTGTSPFEFLVGDIVLMNSGSDTVCSGLYMDQGGTGNYPNSQNVVHTLYPTTPGKVMRLDFRSFETQSGNDFLSIYDGPDASFPLIGTYSGFINPFAVFSSHSTGALTLIFTSTSTSNFLGWIADISCTNPVPLEITDIYPRIGVPGSTTVFATGLLLDRVSSVKMGGQNAAFSTSAVRLSLTVPAGLSQPSPVMAYNSAGAGDTSQATFYPFARQYCYSTSTVTCAMGIKRVVATGTNFRNSSGCGQAGFRGSQFPPIADTLSLNLRQGLSQEFQLSYIQNGFTAIWIDYNQDGAITADERTVANTVAGPGAVVTVNVPSTALLGRTLMRFLASTSSAPTSGCSPGSGSEHEDYLVNIVPRDSVYVLSFSPTRGKAGDVVRLLGKGFARATAVRFGGVTASTFNIVSDSIMTAVVPPAAVTGLIDVQIPTRTFSSLTNFTVIDRSAIRILILHAEEPARVTAIKNLLYRFPEIARVDTFDASSNTGFTPLADSLYKYDAIFAFSDYSWANRATLGNNLTLALNRGVGVVQAVFATAGSGGSDPGGNWLSHQLVPFGASQSGSTVTIGTRFLPSHELLRGVSTFSGGSSSFRPLATTVNSNTIRVADWTGGVPLVVAREETGTAARRVDLGFYPVPNSVNSAGYDATTDGDVLMRNALVWVSQQVNPNDRLRWFTPDTANIGQEIMVYGRFTGVQSLKLGSQSLAYTIVDSSTLKFNVPVGATTNRLFVTGTGWSDTSRNNLVIAPLPVFITTPVTVGYVGEKYQYDVRASHPWSTFVTLSLAQGPNWLTMSGEVNSGITVSPAAGTGISGSQDGPVGTATLGRPMGFAQMPDGRIAFGDQNANKIRVFQPNGTITTLAGSGASGSINGPAASATFSMPSGLTYDTLGNLYVADFNNHMIRKITPQGNVSTLAGSTTSGFVNGTGTQARFSNPYHVFYSKGYLYVSEIGNDAIRRIDLNGNTTTLAGGNGSGFQDGIGTQARFNNPAGLAALPNGDILVADEGNNRIRAVTTAGVVRTLAGSSSGSQDGPIASATFAVPYYLQVDVSGNLVLDDYGNSRIRYINFRTGLVSTLTGSGAGYREGAAGQALFNNPSSILLQGNILYISDQGNARIRQLTLNTTNGGLTGRPTAPGVYPVRVRASTRYGSADQQFDIVVSACRLAPPAILTDSVCEGRPVTLRAVGTGTFNWYLTDTGGVAFATTPQLIVPYTRPPQAFYVSRKNDTCESGRVLAVGAYRPAPEAAFVQQQNKLAYVQGAGIPVPRRYQWLFNGSPIAGATDSVHIATQDGNYALVAIIGQCSDTSDAQFVLVISTKPAKNGLELNLVPNPASNQVSIMLQGPWPAAVPASLIDGLGRVVATPTLKPGSNLVPVAHLPAGLYHLHLGAGKAYPLMVE